MADIAELLKVMQEQMQLQREQMRQQEERHKQQEVSNEERHKQQLALMQQQMEDTRKAGGTMVPQHQTPPFPAFDSTAELWKDYLLRFETFVNANSVPDDKNPGNIGLPLRFRSSDNFRKFSRSAESRQNS